jgi:hypothetical protein
MRSTKFLFGSLIAAGLVLAPITSASAGWHGHGGGRGFRGPLGLVGALVGGAAAIATAPLAIIAGAAQEGYDRGGPQYEGSYRGYPPPDAGPGYGYRAAPRGYPQPQAQYYAPPGYYSARPSRDYYGPPQGYAQRQQYYGYPPGY